MNNNLTGINEEDLKQVVKYTDPLIMAKAGYGLENDYSMNFLPQYENGAEPVWAIQYSINDGTYNGNLNWGMGLTTPQILGCCDFHKPSQNLASRTAVTKDINSFLINYSFQTLEIQVDTKIYYFLLWIELSITIVR